MKKSKHKTAMIEPTLKTGKAATSASSTNNKLKQQTLTPIIKRDPHTKRTDSSDKRRTTSHTDSNQSQHRVLMLISFLCQ